MSSGFNIFRQNSAATDNTATTVTVVSVKRKRENWYGDSDDSDEEFPSLGCYSIPSTIRMRKDNFTPSPWVPSSSSSSPTPYHSTHQPQSTLTPASDSPDRLHFFVRLLSESRTRTLVVHADPSDTVRKIHEKVFLASRIPIKDQRLIYSGKQLQWEQSLAECRIQNDACLELVARMRSTEHPRAWQQVDDMVFQILHLYKCGQPLPGPQTVKSRLAEFLNSTPCHDVELCAGHLQVFLSSCCPAALVMLYMSPMKSNKACAEETIKHFIQNCKTVLPKASYKQCAVIVLEFCKCLKSAAGSEDPLYILCRSCLGSMMDAIGSGEVGNNNFKSSITLQDIWPYVCELASKISKDLVSSVESNTFVGPSMLDVRDFIAFILPVRVAVSNEIRARGPIAFVLDEEGKSGNTSSSKGEEEFCYGDGIKFLRSTFFDLLENMNLCLKRLEEHLGVLEKDHQVLGWSQYLTILKELNSISKLYTGTEEKFWFLMRRRKAGLCYLIVRYAKRSEDNNWILGHKDVINFEARRHLSMMILPELTDEYEELHEMLIDRSQLLAESFEYIARVDPDSLRSGLFMEFKNEEATGPGVLREWFFLVCQAIFNPQNALFVACPTDRRRFYPNPGKF